MQTLNEKNDKIYPQQEYADLDKTQNLDSDATSDDESNQSKLPSINDMFKFIRTENSNYIYQCLVSNCNQEIKAYKNTESQRRKHLGSKTHSMPEYLYPSQKKSIFKEPELISPERKLIKYSYVSQCCSQVLHYTSFFNCSRISF